MRAIASEIAERVWFVWREIYQLLTAPANDSSAVINAGIAARALNKVVMNAITRSEQREQGYTFEQEAEWLHHQNFEDPEDRPIPEKKPQTPELAPQAHRKDPDYRSHYPMIEDPHLRN
jgi:hypothetical protein